SFHGSSAASAIPSPFSLASIDERARGDSGTSTSNRSMATMRAVAAGACIECSIGRTVQYISGPRPAAERSVSARLATAALSPALRKVAELLLVDPEAVAFGTVSSVAERAGTSTPSVIRLATALGFSGFSALRDAARDELSVRLRTDAVRVRDRKRVVQGTRGD